MKEKNPAQGKGYGKSKAGQQGRKQQYAEVGIKLDLGTLRASGVDTIAVAFPDQCGRLLGKRLPIDYFGAQMEREGLLHVCNYLLATDIELEPLQGFEIASWEKGYGDFALQPDPATLRLTRWYPGGAIVICNLLHEDGRPVEQSPRRILERQVSIFNERGLFPKMASELEFYLFKGTYDEMAERSYRDMVPSTRYIIDYSIQGTSGDEEFLRKVRSAMTEARIVVEGTKGEWGKGQHELNLEYCDAIEMADRHIIFKDGLRRIAMNSGIAATFMAKVSHEMAGSSCHIHVSMKDDKGRNAFWDDATEAPSAFFRAFLAGLMAHTQSLTLFFAPTINSYKRYRASTFAPVCIAWGSDNRTCGFRTVGHGQSFRIENRIPGADVNPYMAFAAMLAAGLDGVERELEPPEPISRNAYMMDEVPRVPTSLREAIDAMEAGEFPRRAFGDEVINHYLRLAKLEYQNFSGKVTDWELIRYFERG